MKEMYTVKLLHLCGNAEHDDFGLPLLGPSLPYEVLAEVVVQQLQMWAFWMRGIVIKPCHPRGALLGRPLHWVGQLCLIIIPVDDGLLILQMDHQMHDKMLRNLCWLVKDLVSTLSC